MVNKNDFSLRERKYAQTKLALFHAAQEKLKKKSLKEISVKELCETIPVSEMTFFNYFPEKTDLLVYALQLQGLELGWYLKRWEEAHTNLEIIEQIFDYLADFCQKEEFSFLVQELKVYFAHTGRPPIFKEITPAERLLAFPDLPGIEEIQTRDLPAILIPYIEKAIEAGEFPTDTDFQTVQHAVLAILFGNQVIAMHTNAFKELKEMYRKQLQLLWFSLRSSDIGKTSTL